MSNEPQDTETLEGFWLPRGLRDRVLREASWETAYLRGGVLVTTSDTPADAAHSRLGAIPPGAVAIRWPHLSPAGWTDLLRQLQAARTVAGSEMVGRWRRALEAAIDDLTANMPAVLPALSVSTGYSEEMLTAALAGGDLVNPASLAAALDYAPTWSVATRWETLPRMGGLVHFFPHRTVDRAKAALRAQAPLVHPAPAANTTLGYAAGNVPGTALVIALLASLANHAAPSGPRAPAVVVRNSRHEPLFTPWVLAAVEAADPELVAGLAVMVWDYEDPVLQDLLIRSADLMLAAADDGTIAALDAWRARCAHSLRFHRHGHKISFAALGSTWTTAPDAPRRAASDSSFWDQNGCLSARVHYVEAAAPDYARALAGEMGRLSESLPRGTTPRRFTHRAFDTYASLTGSGRVRLLSGYDDDFAVILDDRPWDPDVFRRTVNSCRGRVVVVRPVRSLMEVPRLLRGMPPSNLQSMSVLLDEDRMEPFAQAVGARGVTALRSLGRGAFPQLSYSWDGLLPLDVCNVRPPGHFTTVEPAPDATSASWV